MISLSVKQDIDRRIETEAMKFLDEMFEKVIKV
jgi:hypothetical protein